MNSLTQKYAKNELGYFIEKMDITEKPTRNAIANAICDCISENISLDSRYVIETGSGLSFLYWCLSTQGNWVKDIVRQIKINQELVAEAQNRYQEAKIYIADSHNLPFKSNSLDALIGCSSYDCLVPLEEALQEVHRVLKPRKKFIYFQPITAGIEVIEEDLSSLGKETVLTQRADGTEEIYIIPPKNLEKFANYVLNKFDADAAVKKYGKKINFTDYYRDMLERKLQKCFGKDNVHVGFIKGKWVGQREDCHKQAKEDYFYFYLGKGVIKAKPFKTYWWDIIPNPHSLKIIHRSLYPVISSMLPDRLASRIEPKVMEEAKVWYATATKEAV